MLPGDWDEGYANAWLGVSAENQQEYDRRWPILAGIPAAVRFISYEPALGPVTLSGHDEKPDWLIWGGESGKNCRPMDPANGPGAIRNECLEMGIPVFAKQWGDYRNSPLVVERGMSDGGSQGNGPPRQGGSAAGRGAGAPVS